jgi:hypothetical protein
MWTIIRSILESEATLSFFYTGFVKIILSWDVYSDKINIYFLRYSQDILILSLYNLGITAIISSY